MKTIAIYGFGYVGKAVYELVKNHYQVVLYDPALGHEPTDEQLMAAEIGIVCVPTPSLPDGRCDTSIVEETVRRAPQSVLLIKSTVEPGTTARLSLLYNKQLVFSPEYVSESTYQNPYYKTMAETPFVVVGGHESARVKVIEMLQQIYGPMATYHQCSSTEAELIKYMANIYSALKITFVNEMFELCHAIGANWHSVREGWLLDKRIEPMSTAVFADKRGFCGKCLPKDTLALARYVQDLGLDLELLPAVYNQNLKYAASRLTAHVPVKRIVCSPTGNAAVR